MFVPAIAILDLPAERPRASRAELVDATGLSPATVGRAVGRLRRQGVLREVALEASGVGRPPRSVELEDHSAFVVGIDAGGRMLRAAIADLGGTLGARIALTVPTGSVQAVVAGISGIVDMPTVVSPGRRTCQA